MTKTATLYKRDTTGKTRQIDFHLLDNTFWAEYGVVGGKFVIDNPTTCEGKNLDKANKTSPEEQAQKEVASKIQKKLDTGYFYDLADLDVQTYFVPMLAHKWEDHGDKILNEAAPIYAQPKLDGCLSYDTLVSTSKGLITVGDIVENNITCEVLTFNESKNIKEFKPIINRMKNGIDINEASTQWYEIELENNKTLKITGNHLVYLPKLKAWRRVDKLNTDDIIMLDT